MYTQQDAYEILIKIFDDVLPESIAKQFSIDFCTRRRCRDKDDCKVRCHSSKLGGVVVILLRILINITEHIDYNR